MKLEESMLAVWIVVMIGIAIEALTPYSLGSVWITTSILAGVGLIVARLIEQNHELKLTKNEK